MSRVNSNQYVSFSTSGHPDDSPGILYQTALKVGSIWTRMTSYLTKTSAPAITEALENAHLLNAEIDPPDDDLSTENNEEPIEGPVAAFDKTYTEQQPLDTETPQPKIPTNRAEINGTVMEFTITINGKTIPLDGTMMKQLLPLFKKLAEDKTETLTTGFSCALDLNDPLNVHIFQNGTEIFKKSCPKLLKDPSIRQHIEQFIEIVKLYQKEGLNIDETEEADNETDIVPDKQPPWVEDVPANGDCMLLAALKHMHGRSFDGENAETAANNLRLQIAEKAKNEKDAEAQIAIIEDIREAREFVKTKREEDNVDLSTISPYNHLFSSNMNSVFNSDNISWSDDIGTAYSQYLSDTQKAYLGQYALNYLNTLNKHKFFVVTKGTIPGTYISRDFKGNTQQGVPDWDNLWVLLLDGNHYQYIDSKDKQFQEAFQKGMALLHK